MRTSRGILAAALAPFGNRFVISSLPLEDMLESRAVTRLHAVIFFPWVPSCHSTECWGGSPSA